MVNSWLSSSICFSSKLLEPTANQKHHEEQWRAAWKQLSDHSQTVCGVMALLLPPEAEHWKARPKVVNMLIGREFKH